MFSRKRFRLQTIPTHPFHFLLDDITETGEGERDNEVGQEQVLFEDTFPEAQQPLTSTVPHVQTFSPET